MNCSLCRRSILTVSYQALPRLSVLATAAISRPGSFAVSLVSRQDMAPKGTRMAGQQPHSKPQKNQRQQLQPVQAALIAEAVADDVGLSSISVDDDVPLPSVDQKYLSDKTFSEFNISPNSKRALAEVLRYSRCSQVQAAAIPVCLSPQDVIAKAKTGTGKTLAFIIPTIEKVLAQRAPRGKVSALVLSPTRELARQIQTETHKMLTFHPELHSLVVYGGVDVKKNLRALNQRMPDILIATPGRCWDLMTQTHDRGLTSLLDSCRVLVLDEADNLLDMGFRPQISKILSGLPPTSQRQTFLFSATFPQDVKSLADVALKRQHGYVDAVGEDVATHTHVEASSLVVGMAQVPGQLLALLAQHMAQEPEYKIMVFLPTANLTAFFAEAFSSAGLRGVMEIHSRMSQPQRDRASARFRSESRLVLFSSDVSARGVDYPNVTYVVQVGAPANREQYIHRAGRTGRAGRAGQATLLLADFERAFLDRLRDLELTRLQPLPTTALLQQQPQQAAAPGGAAEAPMTDALQRDPEAVLARVARSMGYAPRAKAYQSFLGYYKSHPAIKFSTPVQVVDTANQYALEVLGCPAPPGLPAKTVGKMGLKGVPGLVIVQEADRDRPPPQWGLSSAGHLGGSKPPAGNRRPEAAGAGGAAFVEAEGTAAGSRGGAGRGGAGRGGAGRGGAGRGGAARGGAARGGAARGGDHGGGAAGGGGPGQLRQQGPAAGWSERKRVTPETQGQRGQHQPPQRRPRSG